MRWFKEVVFPEQLVSNDLFEPEWMGENALVTTEFTEEQGKTAVTTAVSYSSKEVWYTMLGSGIEYGKAEGYRRLAPGAMRKK